MIDIVLCSDNNYVKPTGVLITSIEAFNKDAICYHIISESLSEISKANLNACLKNKSSKIEFHIIDISVLKKCPIRENEHVSLATYFRLLLPTILPETIKKILYLDGDILCLDSVASLFETDIENYSCAVTPDVRNDDIRIQNRLSLDKQSGYFNAGVMLINLDWWRKFDVQNRAIQFVLENKDLCLFHDQDALNVLLQGTCKIISVRYNFQEHFLETLADLLIDKKYFGDIDYAKENICFIHFTGQKKPWHIECVNPLKKLWLQVFKTTLWKREPLTYKYPKFLKRLKFNLRKWLAKIHLVSEKNIYRKLDYSALEKKYSEILKNIF